MRLCHKTAGSQASHDTIPFHKPKPRGARRRRGGPYLGNLHSLYTSANIQHARHCVIHYIVYIFIYIYIFKTVSA